MGKPQKDQGKGGSNIYIKTKYYTMHLRKKREFIFRCFSLIWKVTLTVQK